MGTPYFSHNHAMLFPIVVHRVFLECELEMFFINIISKVDRKMKDSDFGDLKFIDHRENRHE